MQEKIVLRLFLYVFFYYVRNLTRNIREVLILLYKTLIVNKMYLLKQKMDAPRKNSFFLCL